MQSDQIIQQLANNAAVFKTLLKGVLKEQYLWKPSSDEWCSLEVICHLHDVEGEDFRDRVQRVLEQPNVPLPSIEPVDWVSHRKYMEQDYDQKLRAFLAERAQSVQWLRSLENPLWENTYQHNHFGPMSAHYLLTNWLAHDYLHFRQITRLKYQYLQHHTDHSLEYSGSW